MSYQFCPVAVRLLSWRNGASEGVEDRRSVEYWPWFGWSCARRPAELMQADVLDWLRLESANVSRVACRCKARRARLSRGQEPVRRRPRSPVSVVSKVAGRLRTGVEEGSRGCGCIES